MKKKTFLGFWLRNQGFNGMRRSLAVNCRFIRHVSLKSQALARWSLKSRKAGGGQRSASTVLTSTICAGGPSERGRTSGPYQLLFALSTVRLFWFHLQVMRYIPFCDCAPQGMERGGRGCRGRGGLSVRAAPLPQANALNDVEKQLGSTIPE